MMRATFAAVIAAATLAPTTAHAVTDRTPVCAQEDSAGRCVWDARHTGNGAGDSFVVRESGRVIYVATSGLTVWQ